MRLARSLVLITTLGAAACGGHHPPAVGPGQPAAGGSAAVAAAGGSDAGSAAITGAAAGSGSATGSGSGSAVDANAPLTAEECATMLAHLADLSIASQQVEGEPPMPDDVVQQVRADMVSKHTDECRQQLSRTDWRCVMDAEDVAAYDACAAKHTGQAPAPSDDPLGP